MSVAFSISLGVNGHIYTFTDKHLNWIKMCCAIIKQVVKEGQRIIHFTNGDLVPASGYLCVLELEYSIFSVPD